MKRIVLALGGNALGNTLEEQIKAVKTTAKAIAGLIAGGNQVVIVHGNGPQVGMISLAMEAAAKSPAKTPEIPLSVCVAMSQGYIGCDLQNALREELENMGQPAFVVSIITQTVVMESDPAFSRPTKPIGAFYSQSEAAALSSQGKTMAEDAGRGWRQVVASPMPVDIVEKEAVKTIMQAGGVVIAAGGGGIPVARNGNSLKSLPAVVDKDFAACTLAKIIDADCLIILTAVEKVALNYNKAGQEWLSKLSAAKAQEYIEQGHFAAGSMLPKIQAAANFASSKPGRTALITLLEKAQEGIDGKTGTLITC